jgi:hypothetical protein
MIGIVAKLGETLIATSRQRRACYGLRSVIAPVCIELVWSDGVS